MLVWCKCVWHVLCTSFTFTRLRDGNFSEEFLAPIILVCPIHLYHRHQLYSKLWNSMYDYCLPCRLSLCQKRLKRLFCIWTFGECKLAEPEDKHLDFRANFVQSKLQIEKDHFNLFDTAAVRFISGHHLALIFHLRKISC